MSEQFFYDEFFLDDEDEGIPEEITINGKKITLHFKRNMTLEDSAAAQSKSIKTKVGRDGKVEIAEVNEEEFIIQILSRMIKSWPFTYRNNKPVPITPATIRKMYAEGGEQLAQVVQKYLKVRQENSDFFESSSVEVS
jgi:hypothetical protein